MCQAGLLSCGPPKDCNGRQALQGRQGYAAARLVLNGQLPALGRRPLGPAQSFSRALCLAFLAAPAASRLHPVFHRFLSHTCLSSTSIPAFPSPNTLGLSLSQLHLSPPPIPLLSFYILSSSHLVTSMSLLLLPISPSSSAPLIVFPHFFPLLLSVSSHPLSPPLHFSLSTRPRFGSLCDLHSSFLSCSLHRNLLRGGRSGDRK